MNSSDEGTGDGKGKVSLSPGMKVGDKDSSKVRVEEAVGPRLPGSSSVVSPAPGDTEPEMLKERSDEGMGEVVVRLGSVSTVSDRDPLMAEESWPKEDDSGPSGSSELPGGVVSPGPSEMELEVMNVERVVSLVSVLTKGG